MNKENLKKALVRGIPTGVVIALGVILIRTLLNGAGYLENLSSVYGILTLICITVAFVSYFYYAFKKKEK